VYDLAVLTKLAREHAGDDLLNRTLDGQPKTVEVVSELYRFVVKTFGRDTESDVAKKFWIPCCYFLANAGLTKQELQKLRRPFPIYGEPGFRSIFDEMLENGELSQADYNEIYPRNL
jgi:hypothetical protein